MSDGKVLVIVSIFMLGFGAFIGGITVYSAFKAPIWPPIKIERSVSYGCFNQNASQYGTAEHLSYSFTVNEKPVHLLFPSNQWPVFSVAEGTYPNGTGWQTLTVRC